MSTTTMMAHSPPTIHSLAHHEPVPPSPTLTNPDMILPYDDAPGESHGVSLPYLSLEVPTPPGGTHASYEPNSEPLRDGASTPTKIGTTLANISYQHGAPLSDIGEEESTRGSARSDSGSTTPIDATSMASFADQPWRLEKRKSSDSISTVSHASDLDRWKDFEMKFSSPSSSKETPESGSGSNTLAVPGTLSRRSSFVSSVGDETESNALSERAERILANAKKRLTALEGNLNRARSSVLISPTTKVTGGIGEHRQVGGLYRSISQSGERRFGGMAANRPKLQLVNVQGSSPGHSRVLSEVVIPSRISSVPAGETRSASAMEHGFTRSIDNVLQTASPQLSSAGSSQKSPFSASSHSSTKSPLYIVREDEVDLTPEPAQPRGLGILHSSSVESFKRQSRNESPESLSRPTSQSSTRDLREQMNDLKSKITNLRVQAKVDSLRRRSLQNLRDPTPFNAAEGWDESDGERNIPRPASSAAPGRTAILRHKLPIIGQQASAIRNVTSLRAADRTPQKPLNGENGQTPNFQTPNNMYDDERAGSPTPTSPPTVAESTYEDANEDMLDENGDPITASEEEQIYLNEALEESLREQDIFEDAVPVHPGSEPERHEDRPDAFDYEHFILHSALGSYSRLNGRASGLKRHSYASLESVETARVYSSPTGDIENDAVDDDEDDDDDDEDSTIGKAGQDRPGANNHARNKSSDSVSTLATFATATEGNGEDDDEDEEESMPQDILNWSGNQYNNQVHPKSNGTSKTQANDDDDSLRTPTKEKANGHTDLSLDTVISSLMSLANSDNDPTTPRKLSNNLEAVDRELLEGLLETIGNFCIDITQKASQSPAPTNYQRKMWRRRLDAARMVIDGEIDVEPA